MSSCPFDVGIWRCSSAIGTLRPNPVELETEISGMVGSVTLVLTGPRIYRNSVRSLPHRGGPKCVGALVCEIRKYLEHDRTELRCPSVQCWRLCSFLAG